MFGVPRRYPVLGLCESNGEIGVGELLVWMEILIIAEISNAQFCRLLKSIIVF